VGIRLARTTILRLRGRTHITRRLCLTVVNNTSDLGFERGLEFSIKTGYENDGSAASENGLQLFLGFLLGLVGSGGCQHVFCWRWGGVER
jgi:hypothetical protein